MAKIIVNPTAPSRREIVLSRAYQLPAVPISEMNRAISAPRIR